MKDLSIVVAGGGSGLGLLLCRMCLQRGASGIGVIDLNLENAQQQLQQNDSAGRSKISLVKGDISSVAGVKEAFDQVVEELGCIDTLINSAAIYPRRPLLEITDADWDASNAINVKGTYHLMVAAVRQMCQQPPKDHVRGRIVNITSVDAFKAHPQNAHYAATKAAVVSLTKSFAHELAPEGILVNSIAPAGMATEKAKTAGFLGELAAANPLGRAAQPQEIAEWVLMAGGTGNTYMTGENVVVSGGYVYV